MYTSENNQENDKFQELSSGDLIGRSRGLRSQN